MAFVARDGRMRFVYAAILGFVGFVTSFGAHIVAVNLPVYARLVGVGVGMIGLLIAAYDLAEIVAKPAFGAIADRAGMKKTRVWLLFGNELPPLHGLKEALLVLVNMEGPVLLEML
ncbi:MAG: hypothetical protein DMG56_11955 [Acidobacteria bacterium]|nr:MAG: hypothetical protein DMG56_11955 [Acidobacteriota bacterium]